MIDIHTHILPGIDDGSKDVEMSVAMLREQARQGIDEVVFTPHFYAHEVSPDYFLRRRNRAWEELKPHMEADFPKVHFGAEVLYFNGMGKVDDVKKLCIDDTDFMLLEMPYSRWTSQMVDDIYELMYGQNLKIIMAHIERCMFFQPKELYDDLLENGVVMQSNVSFFTEWKTKAKAKHLFNRGRIHIIASDCHNMTSRAPNLTNCVSYFSDIENNIIERNVLK